ncbi:MAG: flavin prenyltransferase UbiX [Planctomycetaceae bacterium]
MADIVLAMTGASGAVYGLRLLEVLIAAGRGVHLTISPAAVEVMKHELGLDVDLDNFDLEQLLPHGPGIDSSLAMLRPAIDGGEMGHGSSIFSDSSTHRGTVRYHHYQNWNAPIASGSAPTAGMVVCPCSMGTLAAVASGLSTNLIHRAADVHLKERRRLIVVPRETPLGAIQLDNMKRLCDAGGVILPAMPGFYHHPLTIHDLVDFVVARICDQLGVEVNLMRRWGN